MRKLIEQNGPRVKTGWPIQCHRYEPDRLPDPADTLDCLLIVNDRSDGVPRGRLVVSNGASYDTVAWLTDIPAGSLVAAPALPAMRLPPPLPVAVPAADSSIAALMARVDALERAAQRIDPVEQIIGQHSARLAECERCIDVYNAAANEIRKTKGRT